ncbi:hypothetical protein BN1708_005505 [Verticillium longisporum]|uniref:AAA+ ATPase domain-containing protein n=1 Tax=Verticillium longisporum TaxID=100787 RepID=A0A0G4MBN7_VERLO|nr:hypothetical protein BN1708_005505 [Verticillium longisporum]
MSSLEDLGDVNRRDQDDKKKDDGDKDKDRQATVADANDDADMEDAEHEEDVLDDEILGLSTQDIQTRKRLLENDSRIMRSEVQHLTHEKATMGEKIKENNDKIANNRQLPYLVGNVVELLDLDPTAESSEEGANIDLDATRVGKSAVIKTSTRQTIFLPLIGLVDPATLKPGDLIGVNKDSYLILDTLPAEYDSRVKAMEVDEKPTEKYTDVGGLDKQIEELVEAIVWPMKEADRFKKIGIKAPKGALMYGPPGTGKTLLARACAAQTDATFLKLAGPQLVQITDEFGGAMLKAVCVEAGMIALRGGKEKIGHEHYVDAIAEVQAKKKDTVNFYA